MDFLQEHEAGCAPIKKALSILPLRLYSTRRSHTLYVKGQIFLAQYIDVGPMRMNS
jgi:hypothetical protein